MNTLVIIGSAHCAPVDINEFARWAVFPDRCDFMNIGLDSYKHPWPVKYIATNHVEDIPAIRQRRASNQLANLDYQLISFKPGPGVDIVQPLGPVSGSSSLLGALAAISLGYERIVLCGCPLIGNAPEGNPYEAFLEGWELKKDELIGKVKSMSGLTRKLLGSPTEEWLHG